MNGYLVLVRCNLDDVPVRFFPTLEEAAIYAQRQDIEETADNIAQDVFGVELSQANYVDVVKFQDGVPVDYRIRVVDFDHVTKQTT